MEWRGGRALESPKEDGWEVALGADPATSSFRGPPSGMAIGLLGPAALLSEVIMSALSHTTAQLHALCIADDHRGHEGHLSACISNLRPQADPSGRPGIVEPG